MRLIYEKGRHVGKDPIGHYVYLWCHGDTNIYVGQGVAYRWEHPLGPDDPNARYFLTHHTEMSCVIINERLSTVEAGRLEIDAIARHKPLLNRTGGSTIEPRKACANESAAERACRIAKFISSPARRAVLSFFVDHGAGVFEEVAVRVALNMEPAALWKALDTVEWRLSDRNNQRFPGIETIGALYLMGVRGEPGPKRAIFATPGPEANALAAKAWRRRGDARG
jgi:hypothetical protein